MISNLDVQILTDLVSEAAGNGHGPVRAGEWTLAGMRAGAQNVQKPQLTIAEGGAGREIATRHKAAHIERTGRLPDSIAILAFDSAEDPISVRERRFGETVTLERGSEFFPLDRVPLAGIKRTKARHPEIVERMGVSLDRIYRASIHDGAAQQRSQGLLSHMWNAPMIRREIRNRIRRLAERSRNPNDEIGGATGFNVVLIGSACGGQGSGGILDMAYMVRSELQELGDLGESSRVLGLIVLPGAFPNVRGPNLRPNTHAFFLELDHLMQGGGFSATYPGGMHIESLERPFDCVFVLDGVDERGKAWPNLEEVCDLGAQSLSLLLSTEVGMQEIFHAINEQGVLSGVSAEGHGTYLGTMGQAVIRFPAQQVADRCAVRSARALAESCLAPGVQGSAPDLPAGAEGLRERLMLNANGAPLAAQFALPSSVEQASPEEKPALVRTATLNFLQRRIHGDAYAQMQHTAQKLAVERDEDLAGRLQILAANGHLPTVEGWLHSTGEALQTDYTALVAEAGRLAAAAEQAQKTLDSASIAMEQAADALFLWRKAQVQNAIARYLETATQLAQLRLQQRTAELAAEIVLGRFQVVRRQLQAASEATIRLRQAQDRLAARALDLERLTGSRSEINLADPELVSRLYDRYMQSPEALRLRAVGEIDLLQWGKLSTDTLAAHLLQTTQDLFAPIRLITVEQVLAPRAGGPDSPTAEGEAFWDTRSAQQWIGKLTELAAGAWNLERALLPAGGADLASFLTLGVCDATDTIFGACGLTLVSTHDPERVIALRTVYGAAFDALKSAPQWRSDYERLADRTSFHVLPGFAQA